MNTKTIFTVMTEIPGVGWAPAFIGPDHRVADRILAREQKLGRNVGTLRHDIPVSRTGAMFTPGAKP